MEEVEEEEADRRLCATDSNEGCLFIFNMECLWAKAALATNPTPEPSELHGCVSVTHTRTHTHSVTFTQTDKRQTQTKKKAAHLPPGQDGKLFDKSRVAISCSS